MNYLRENIKNIIDYNIRTFLNFSRKNYSVKPENCDGLFEAEALDREKVLFEKYDFSLIKSDMTKCNYCENIYMLDVLDKYFPIEFNKSIKVCDIGSKNWNYIKGEHAFFSRFCEGLDILGVELDANRLYSNFYSRGEVAKFNIKNISEAKYIADDFLNVNDLFDYIVWFLPFVYEFTHIKWGLPKSKFNPEKLLMHAYNSLNTNGKMFIVNQGEEEFKEQIKMFEEMKIPYSKIGVIGSPFMKYKFFRHASIVVKL